MSVQVYWFTEQPYSFTNEEYLAKHQKDSYFTLSNKFFDPGRLTSCTMSTTSNTLWPTRLASTVS